jgi:pimeloyl-ACP methyl ester carboxylesterase
MTTPIPPEVREALAEVARFPLLDALYGRRSRRFALGAEIPDGPLAYRSAYQPLPLTELERMLVLSSMTGTTGWHYSITRNARYAPHVANYAGAAAGRTFPSAAGFHTAELFFTDDSGTYLLPTRDAGALVDPAEEEVTPELVIERHAARIRRISDHRLYIPAREPYMEGHNTWCVNLPGSLLAVPVADVAQHMLLMLCFIVQNGYCLYDDVNRRSVPGIEQFAGLVDLEAPYPLTFLEQYALTEATAELATSCYAGVLTLQAMGLGGWMFDGIDRFTMLGASGDPDVPGLGFRYDTDERWATPNPTGLPGVFEAFCPPHYGDMAAATTAVVARKFGPGGPFDPATPGAWTDSPGVRGSAQRHGPEFQACVALQATYVLDTFGKFPGTVPTVFLLNYVQAHHLDLDFYDRFFRANAYLPTHADHLRRWHPDTSLVPAAPVQRAADDIPPLRFGTVHLATGPRVHHAESGDPTGEVILFLHGWPDSWFSFSRLLPLLPARYHAYAVDQRGFGDSERPARGYTIDELAADVVAFLDAVEVGRATVVGHSFGSFVARRVAQLHPDRVSRLVLIDGAIRPVNAVTVDVQNAVRELPDPVPIEFAREFQASTAHVPLPEAFFDGIVAESVTSPSRVWREVFDGLLALDDEAQLGQISAPTLIVWGERDALFSREEQDRLAAAIPGARLTTYPETGHCPNWERPERLATDLDAFLRATKAAAAPGG